MDKKDRKLLTYLDQNSRQSINQLAKKLQLSNNSVKNRIDKLTQDGVIQRFSTIIDIGKLGFIPVRFFIKLTQTSTRLEEEIIGFCINTNNLGWIVSVRGYWDINTYFTFQSLQDIHDFYEKLQDNYGSHIADLQMSLYKSITSFTRPYLIEGAKKEPRKILSNSVKIEIHEDEYKLLAIFAQNSRTPVIELAEKLGVTTKTIIEKIKKLEKLEIITGYRIQLDLNKIGFSYYKLHITLTNGERLRLSELKQYLAQTNEVLYIDEMTAGYDIEVEIEMQGDIEPFLQQLKNKFTRLIANIEVLEYYKQHYEKFFPDIS